MLGSSLKRLAKVADMSRADLITEAITLTPTEQGTLAWYGGTAGNAVGAGIEVQEGGLERAVSVGAIELRDMTSLFPDDADVSLSCGESELALKAGPRRITLRYLKTPNASAYADLRAARTIGRAKVEDIASEVLVASEASATTWTTPILTGIYLRFRPSAIGIQTINGTSLIFESTIPETDGTEDELIAPTLDLTQALRLLNAESVVFGRAGGSLILISEHAAVRVPCLMGAWVSTKHLRGLEFAESLTLPAPMVRTMATAARVLRAAGEDVVIRPDTVTRAVIVETKESELGRFSEEMAGQVSQKYVIAAKDLDVIAKLGADEVKIQFSKTMALVAVGRRRLFISLRLA